MTKIPLVCLSFNQPSYLLSLINHWQFYNPNRETHPIIVFDNGSTSKELLLLFDEWRYAGKPIEVIKYGDNNFIPNLKHFIENHIKPKYDYYVLSDCDILPHPSTPWNYLEVFKHLIDSGYHRAGFGLILDDLAENLHLKNNIIHDEMMNLQQPFDFEFEGKIYNAHKAALDTTFCMYTTKNTGWYAPMSGKDWSNSVRVFKAFHLTWHLDEDRLNPEMEYYFQQAKYRVPGEPSAGQNNHRPKKYSPPI